MKRFDWVRHVVSAAAFSAALTGMHASAFAGDAAAAEVLFNEARALVAKGDYEKACPKLEESQRLDAGMGTLFNLGDCYEHVGKTASAWAAFREVAAEAGAAGQQARQADARARAAALEPKLVTLVVDVAPASSGLANLVVKRDAVDVGKAQWGSAIPIDPGKHVIAATADGKEPWRSEVTIAENARSTTVIVPAMKDIVVAPKKAHLDSAPTSSVGSTQRTIGIIVGGAGIIGLGVGTIFGARSMSKHDDDQRFCDPNSVCDAKGVLLRNEARDAGNVSTVAFIAGGALFAGGLVLFLTAPRAPSSRSTAIGVGLGSVTFKGAF